MSKKAWWIAGLCALVLLGATLGSSLWGWGRAKAASQFRNQLEGQYQRAFYDLMDTLENLEVRLSKLRVSAGSQQEILGGSEIWRQANLAQEQLSRLPMGAEAVASTLKFINQLGDYAYRLTLRLSGGGKLEAADWEQLSGLHSRCKELLAQLEQLDASMVEGGMLWSDWPLYADEEEETPNNAAVDDLAELSQTTLDYPALIYDGPFSDSRRVNELRALPATEKSEQEALTVAQDFLNKVGLSEEAQALTAQGETYGDIPTWSFTAGETSIQVSKQGGAVLMMMRPWWTEEPLTPDEATRKEMTQRAQALLETLGLPDMSASWWQTSGGTLVINFAATILYDQEPVLCYPDLVKVKLSLADGSLLGFEAMGYYANHRVRQLPTQRLLPEQLSPSLNPNLVIDHQMLALIPLENGEERLCYELSGRFEGERYLIYLDISTGEELQILRVLETETGQLTL